MSPDAASEPRAGELRVGELRVGELHAVQQRWPRPARYVAASSLDSALAALADPALAPARAIAGGTDLLLEIERGGRRGIATLVDLSRAADAASITIAGGVARLGPCVTHNDVIREPALVAGALPLAQACLEVGSPQLRNRGTVAGNVVTASPANDTISALLALGASVVLRSARGSRAVDLDAFFTGFRTTVLAPDELVTEIVVPLLGAGAAGGRAGGRGIFVKVGNRAAQAISVLHLAAVVETDEDGVVQAARLALGSVGPRVVLVPGASGALVGRRLGPDTIAAAADAAAAAVDPIDDVRATADYRRAVLPVVVARALSALAAGRERERWPATTPTLGRLRASGPPPRPDGVSDNDHHRDIEALVNGVAHRAPAAAGATLLEWLRDEAGLRGSKEGCGEGECGACTVSLDGAAVMSCLVPAARADGAEITTVEGVASPGDALHPVQDALVAASAVQCGFCTPGFVVAGAKLLEEHPHPSAEEVRFGLSGNLCRCTGYTSIVAALAEASEAGR